ncbi:MAG: GCN5-related N-acetyltransferase [Microgenomates group bacterium GW2011_GWB1_44_8]|nr:MAG: GCN5-related N-acetyltransferase [Microgenomates group bacterium GW2011_GWB1_44_8]
MGKVTSFSGDANTINIKIDSGKDAEIRSFERREWAKANVGHYGKNVNYNQRTFIYKATINTKVVGSIRGSHEGGVVCVSEIIVSHSQKRVGIGRLLMQKAEGWAKKHKAHKIYLITGKGWIAEKFYQSLGYKQAVILKNHNFNQEFVLFEKFI